MNIKNHKNFKVGEKVRGIIDTYNGGKLVEGNITYIHPTNGWLTIKTDHLFIRTKSVKTTVRYDFTEKFPENPYPHTLWMSDVFRVGEDIPNGRECEWKGALELAARA